jgi:PhnB protein
MERNIHDQKKRFNFEREDYMAKKAKKPVPAGLRTVTPQIWFNGNCHDAIGFYERAFGARLIGPVDSSPDGKVMHAQLAIGNSRIFLSDVMGAPTSLRGPDGFATGGFYLYVANCDTLFNRAVNAGAKVLMPVSDAFWGDRTGQLQDPFGHIWFISTQKLLLSRKELKKAEEEFYEKGMPATVTV